MYIEDYCLYEMNQKFAEQTYIYDFNGKNHFMDFSEQEFYYCLISCVISSMSFRMKIEIKMRMEAVNARTQERKSSGNSAEVTEEVY